MSERLTAPAILARFQEAGAQIIAPDILQPAGALLDLYGEDIRARAFVTQDPIRGETMLRPDFTVPVVQAHLAGDQTEARYAYSGPVFRQQETEDRPREYLQVGFEMLGNSDAAAADAEIFALFSAILADANTSPTTGDIGILIAAVDGLSTTKARRAELRRHIWRPKRFRALLDMFTQPATAPNPALSDAPEIGRRSRAEIDARLAAMAEEAAAPPLSQTEAEVLDAILTLRLSTTHALGALRDIAVDLPALAPALDRFETRLTALDARNIDVDALPFEASYGRTSMEYYDGFVFGFNGSDPLAPPLATGGRYDALTAQLGAQVPAVGGVIRPEGLV